MASQQTLDSYFSAVPEPQRSTIQFLRRFFVTETGLEEKQKNNTPFYYYNKKWFGFLSYNKDKDHEIYISFTKGGMVEHPALDSEGRKQAKIYRVDPHEDIDVNELKKITELLKQQY
jgi:hypothetical protein